MSDEAFWDTLGAPWQAALEMAWEACCEGTNPIGAVITNANGQILARGRNRILDMDAPPRQVYGDMLAHAELNALLSLDGIDQSTRHTCTIYTTAEPCPLCMGAIYMSSVRTVCFASRDPYAGSTNLLGTTWYLSQKPVKAIGPQNSTLEIILMAISLEFELSTRREGFSENILVQRWREIAPQGVELGQNLHRYGELRAMKQKAFPANQVFNQLAYQVK